MHISPSVVIWWKFICSLVHILFVLWSPHAFSSSSGSLPLNFCVYKSSIFPHTDTSFFARHIIFIILFYYYYYYYIVLINIFFGVMHECLPSLTTHFHPSVTVCDSNGISHIILHASLLYWPCPLHTMGYYFTCNHDQCNILHLVFHSLGHTGLWCLYILVLFTILKHLVAHLIHCKILVYYYFLCMLNNGG
jgi:hypothetical protein